MKKLIFLFLLAPIIAYPQNTPVCATPMDCYQVKERQREDAIRLKKDQEDAIYRQQQLELEAAQLRELQEQRAVLEEELTEMNERQIEAAEDEKNKEQKSKVQEIE